MQKNSLWKALLFSALICLAGAVVWGLVYSIGYMVYIVALGTVVLAGVVYRKFYKFNYISFIWIVLLSIIFNEIATFLALNLEIVNELMPELSFARGMELLFELISTNAEVKSAIISDTIFNILAVVIGGVVAWVSINKQEKKNKSATTIATTATTNNEVVKSTIEAKEEKVDAFSNYFNTMKQDFKKVVEEYKQNKDKEAFKEKISTLKAQYIGSLQRQENKDKVKAQVEKELLDETISNVDKVTLTTILKLL